MSATNQTPAERLAALLDPTNNASGSDAGGIKDQQKSEFFANFGVMSVNEDGEPIFIGLEKMGVAIDNLVRVPKRNSPKAQALAVTKNAIADYLDAEKSTLSPGEGKIAGALVVQIYRRGTGEAAQADASDVDNPMLAGVLAAIGAAKK